MKQFPLPFKTDRRHNSNVAGSNAFGFHTSFE